MTDQTNKPLQGISLLVLGLMIFSLQDVIMKIFSADMALQEVIFLRGVIALILVGGLMARQQGSAAFKTGRPVLCLIRGLAGFTCFSTFSMSLAVLPLADAMPLYYTSPLFVIALSIPMLGENVGIRRWLAIAIGFLGVVFVSRPSIDYVDPAMLLALVSALAYSFQSLLARKLGPTESALGMTFYSMTAFVALSGLTGLLFGNGWLNQIDHASAQYLFRAWTMPTGGQWLLIGAVGIISTAGFLCISQAYRLAPSSIVAPFEYSSLPFAILWGWMFWSALPTSTTVIGSLLIIGSGLFAISRSRTRKSLSFKRRGLRSQS